MNEEEPELDGAALGRELAKRNQLFAYVDTMLEVQADMRGNKTIQAFMDYAKKSLDRALDEIVEASPADEKEMSRCLVNIKTALYLKRTLERIISLGVQAETLIREQDEDVIRDRHPD